MLNRQEFIAINDSHEINMVDHIIDHCKDPEYVNRQSLSIHVETKSSDNKVKYTIRAHIVYLDGKVWYICYDNGPNTIRSCYARAAGMNKHCKAFPEIREIKVA